MTMKWIMVLCMLMGVAYGQTTGYFRYDSSRFEKVGGNNELIILNGTRGVTGGVLTNTGNGRTAFVSPAVVTPAWALLGNAGTVDGTNFVGTTDAVKFSIRTNNLRRFTINANGAYGLGTGEDYGTAGQFLQSNGTGTSPTWASATSGSGTTNQMAKWISSTTLGDGTLTDLGGVITGTMAATTGSGMYLSSSVLSTGNLLRLSNGGTASDGLSILRAESTGANAASNKTAYGVNVLVSNTGTSSTNVGLLSTVQSGSNNYAVQLVDGSEGNLKILQSDASGHGTWVSPSSIATAPPTLQAVLTAGSTLNTDAAIDGGGNSIGFSNVNDFEVLSAGSQLFKAKVGHIDAEVGVTAGFSVTMGTYSDNESTHNSALEIFQDSTGFSPYQGKIAIDTLNNLSLQNKILGWIGYGVTGTGNLGYVNIGSGLSLSSGSLSLATALPNGTTATTQSAGDNSTKVATTAYVATAAGAYLPLAGGTMVGNITATDNTYDIGASGATRFRTGYFATSIVSPVATHSTSVTSPLLIGSVSANGTITIEGNNAGAGNTAANSNILLKTGNTPTTAMMIDNQQYIGIGPSATSMSTFLEVANNTTGGYGTYPAITISNSSTGGYASLFFNRGTGVGNIKGIVGLEATTNNFYFRNYGTQTQFQDNGANVQMSITASTGAVAINNGSTAGTSMLYVNGSFGTAYVAKTANYTATVSDYTINFTSGTDTLTLPTAVGIAGRIYTIVNSGTSVNIKTTSSQTFVNIAGTPITYDLLAVGASQVQSNGANWMKLN